MSANKPSAEQIAQLHADWEGVHTRLREQEQELSRSIEHYVRGEAPRPEALMKEVEEMRAQCAQRFRALMEAIRQQGGPPPQEQPQQRRAGGPRSAA